MIQSIVSEPVRLGRFQKVELIFLKIGHTKTEADEMFAEFSRTMKSVDFFNHLYALHIFSPNTRIHFGYVPIKKCLPVSIAVYGNTTFP